MFESALKTLRVESDAEMEAIREAYVRMVRRYPPEHFPEKFAAVRRAYNQLCLDDSFLEEIAEAAPAPGLGSALAGLLFGDLPEAREDSVDIDFSDLAPLLDAAERKDALSAALERAAAGGIPLMLEEDGHANGV